MSFDLAVWRENAPVTAPDAAKTYEQLRGGSRAGVASDSRVAAFYAQLTRRYPEPDALDERSRDSSPWAAALDVSPAHVIMAIVGSRAGELIPFVRELAARHELVCFDPQQEVVHQPPAFAELPGMTLMCCDGSLVTDPDPQAITDALRRLSRDNWYVVLEQREHWYVQVGLGSTAGAPEGRFALEYRAGSAHRHYRCTVADLDDVAAVFAEFSRGESPWRRRFSWERVVF
jgi:hypothetical protein